MVNDGSKNLCNLEFVSWPKKVSTTVTKHTCQCLTIVLCVYSGNQLKLYFPGWVGGWWGGWVFSSTVRAQVEHNTFKPISLILQEAAVIYMNINNKYCF